VTSPGSRWGNRWALPILLAAMDAGWMTPYALVGGALWARPGTPLLSPIALFGLLLLAQTLTRALLARGIPLGQTRLLLVVSGALAVGAAVGAQYGQDPWWGAHGLASAVSAGRPEVPAAVIAALAWGRGLTVGRTGLDYPDVEAAFILGFASLSGLALLLALAGGVPPLRVTALAAVPAALAFLAAGLLALPLARVRSVHERTHAPGGAITGSGHWFAATTVAVLALLGIALLAGSLLRLDVRTWLLATGRAVDPLLSVLVLVVAVPIGLVVWAIVELLRMVLHRGTPPAPLPPPAALPRWLESLPHRGGVTLPPGAAAAARWGAGALVAALLLLWLARMVVRPHGPRRGPGADEDRESVWSAPDLRRSWRMWREKFRTSRRKSPTGPEFGRGPAGEIRRAYATFLGAAASCGRPRPQEATPCEFRRDATRTWPDLCEPLARLTRVYTRVRYGLLVPDPQDVEAAGSDLARILAALGPPSDRGSVEAKRHRPPSP